VEGGGELLVYRVCNRKTDAFAQAGCRLPVISAHTSRRASTPSEKRQNLKLKRFEIDTVMLDRCGWARRRSGAWPKGAAALFHCSASGHSLEHYAMVDAKRRAFERSPELAIRRPLGVRS